MAIVIREYEHGMAPAVIAFNERLSRGGVTWHFPTSPTPGWLPPLVGRRIYQQYFLALDDQLNARGGYCIKHQDYRIGDSVRSIGQIALPLSEGVVDRNYAQLGAQLLLDAVRKQPLLYALGMGDWGEAITRLVKAAGWRVSRLPFYFSVVRPYAFLRNAQILRQSASRRFALDALAFSGLGWLGFKGMHLALARRMPSHRGLTVEEVGEFSDWADEVWTTCAPDYPYCAVRDAATLRILYPHDNPRFIRLKIGAAGRIIGWAVVLATDLTEHKQFGEMRLGSIVDAFARPADADIITVAADRLLRSRKVDLIVCNQSSSAWCNALKKCGYVSGPSNFFLATSRKLTEILDERHISNESLFINRGDGDGPINL
jgi:hypothetical protein